MAQIPAPKYKPKEEGYPICPKCHRLMVFSHLQKEMTFQGPWEYSIYKCECGHTEKKT